MDRTGEKQKKVVYDFICDDLYTPMKFKEMAMLLQVPKTRRQELKEVLEELEAEGKIAGGTGRERSSGSWPGAMPGWWACIRGNQSRLMAL